VWSPRRGRGVAEFQNFLLAMSIDFGERNILMNRKWGRRGVAECQNFLLTISMDFDERNIWMNRRWGRRGEVEAWWSANFFLTIDRFWQYKYKYFNELHFVVNVYMKSDVSDVSRRRRCHNNFLTNLSLSSHCWYYLVKKWSNATSKRTDITQKPLKGKRWRQSFYFQNYWYRWKCR